MVDIWFSAGSLIFSSVEPTEKHSACNFAPAGRANGSHARLIEYYFTTSFQCLHRLGTKS